MSRNSEKEMLKSWGSFDTTVKLCLQAHSTKNINRFTKLLDTLENTYYKFDEDWRSYKEYVIKNTCETEEAFNKKSIVEGVETPDFVKNDEWSDSQMQRYISTSDLLHEILDKQSAAPSQGLIVDSDFAIKDVEAEIETLESCIGKLKLDIEQYNDHEMPNQVVLSYENLIGNYHKKIDNDIRQKALATESQNLKQSFHTFAQTVRTQLNECTLLLVKKMIISTELAEAKLSTTLVGSEPSNNPEITAALRPKEQVFLEKTKPPKFSGDDVDFPEFKRKWLAQVNKANLPEESELDKLREFIPKYAKDQLYGVNTLTEAWSILTKRFGNEQLISKKLKSQLKNVQCTGKTDPEKIISLKIKVRNIVTRLEAISMGGALTHDPEFLSAVYCALPDRHRVRWLEYEKGIDQWDSMLKFLDKSYDQANEELALLSVYGREEKPKPPLVRSAGVEAAAANSITNEDDRKDAKKRARETCGKCPVCGQNHTWQRKDNQWWPSDRLVSCKKFRDMNLQQKSEAIEKFKGCPRCTSWNHQRTDCKMKANSCSVNSGSGVCTGDHSKLLHGTTNVYCAALQVKISHVATSPDDPFTCVHEDQETVFYLQNIPAKNSSFNSKARVFWDKGSNRVLIKEEYALQNNLLAKAVTYIMKVVNSEPVVIQSHIYLIDLIDMYGNVHTVWGYGVKSIMNSAVPDLSAVRKLFPHVPTEAFDGMPEQDVDILIGLNKNELQPAGGLGSDKVGGLSVLRSLFGCGWVVGGHHEDIIASHYSISSEAAMLKIAKIQIEPVPSLTPEFWEAEGMGVVPPPRCDSCKRCSDSGPCSEKHYVHSIKKQAELDLIKSKTKLHEGEIWCDYPFQKNPSCLSYNRSTVVKVAEKVEKDLIKDSLHEKFNEQIQDFIKRGVAVKLSTDELESWTGPCQYITIHAVQKDSVTTPVRVVTNSSFNNKGKSLNSCMVSGPNSLNPMLDVMLRYRCQPVAIQFDMAKAYNTIRTGPVERHLRRFVWRFSPNDDWEDFALDRMHFGDIPAACILEVGKDICADKGRHIDEEAAKRIENDIYVDDGLTGGRKEQVERFVGKKDPETGNYDGTFSQILGIGNFRIKAFGISGQKPTEESKLMGDKVLGYDYDIEKDMLAVKFNINLSKKRRSVRVEPDLTLSDIHILKSKTLTKRLLLGVVNGFRDFLGLAAPFTIRYKVLMREFYLLKEALTWDEEIPPEFRPSWINLLVETLENNTLLFPRCCRPENTVEDLGPDVTGTCDFGTYGYEARVYLRWELVSEVPGTEFISRLALCKARVPPLQGLTVPRGELTALCLLSRLVLAVIIALQKLDLPPRSSIMLVDSKCSQSSVYSTKKLLAYFQNRVAEIRDNMAQARKLCPMEEIAYVESALNPSDLATKATATISELGPESVHQTGPAFFCLPRTDWPVSYNHIPEAVPEVEYRVRDKLVFSAAARSNFCDPKIYSKNPWYVVEELLQYSNSLTKILNILARYLRGLGSALHKSGAMKIENPEAYNLISGAPDRMELQKAYKLLLLHGMPATSDALDEGKLASLLPLYEGKLIVTRGRLGEKSLTRLLGVSSLPILMNNTRVAYLFMVHAHQGEFGLVHRSAVVTLARSRTKVWIVKGRNLARKVVNDCQRCTRDRKELLIQQMADLKPESLTVSPPWTNVALDFAGPILVRGEVNKRAKLKCWVLVYTCRATRAVCMLATTGYSTADFLCKHEEFVSRKGQPDSIVSDRGTQLVSAGIVIANKDLPVNKLDWQKVTSVNNATNWYFVPIGGQHRNGLSEATVKILKRSLSLAIHPSIELYYSELVTLLARISFSINSRPLSLKSVSTNSQQEDDLMPITPNHLLLGRASTHVPNLDYDDNTKFSARMSYVQQVYDVWWQKWIQNVLPTLVPCKRWKEVKKNVKVDDIVMMKYPGNMRDDYRLARVSETFPDEKGLVRTVKVSYRKRDKREPHDVYWKKAPISEIVPIQRLAIIQASGEPAPTGGVEDQLPPHADADVHIYLIKASLLK